MSHAVLRLIIIEEIFVL